jgi:RNA polymerase sigma-70 factor (ECF subfamily)
MGPTPETRHLTPAMQPHQAERFAALWTAAQPTIAGFIRTLVPDYLQADEVLQRVAVTLVRKYQQYDPSRSFTAWAVGVAKYEVLYYRRERATDKHLFGDDIVEQIASRYEILAEDVDPLREALRHCLDQLEGRSKRVIDLRYRRGLKSRAIAEEMTLSSGAVRMLLCRVRETLRSCIERYLSRQDYYSTKNTQGQVGA